MPQLVRSNLVFAWLALISAALIFMAIGQAQTERKISSFDEINVQRINVVEPDGKPRLIIASRARAAGLYWGGKEYKHHNRSNGGVWFMNDDGDEVGGLTFGNSKQGERYSANSRLTFDQYKQDETISVSYQEENGMRRAGLYVWDRADKSLEPAIELSDRLARAMSEEERARLRAEMTELAKSYKPTPDGTTPERLFAGKIAGESVVKLADPLGRPRLLLKVDTAGVASIEFLDESGKVVRRVAGP